MIVLPLVTPTVSSVVCRSAKVAGQEKPRDKIPPVVQLFLFIPTLQWFGFAYEPQGE